MLTFASDDQRQQAERLMQPALIRVVDNLRKRLETSDWRGDYQEQLLWPPTATDPEKQRVMALKQQMADTDAEQQAQLQAELARLPVPYPAYELHLHHPGRPDRVIDVWQLCSQACFVDYVGDGEGDQAVVVDQRLLDDEGEVDWLQLDQKVVQLIDAVFPDSAPEGHLSE